MTKIQLSATMEEALTYGARNGFQGTVAYCNRRTEEALLSRNLITYDHNVTDDSDVQWMFPVLTAAGWVWLKDNAGIERPADAGRLTLEEAWADAEQIAEDDRTAAADWDAAYALEDAEELARMDAGRWTLEECFSTGGWHQVGQEEIDYLIDAGRLTLEEALELAHADAETDAWIAAIDRTAPLVNSDAGRLTLDEAWTAAERIADVQRQNAARMAVDPEPPRRDGWLDQEAGSGPGAGPSQVQVQLSGRWGVTPPDRVAEILGIELPAGAVEIQDYIVSPRVEALEIPLADVLSEVHDAVIREANRITRMKDDRVTGYREHVPEDDMYVDRDAWKAAEIRLQKVASDAAEAMRNLAMADTRSQYVRRDTHGNVITYRNIPVPADLAGHWSGIEAISWTRGVESVYRANLSAVQKMRRGQ